MVSLRFGIRLSIVVLGWGLLAATPSATATDDRFEVFVLGIAQDGGVPHLGCDKACCTEARESGGRLYPSCLGIRDRTNDRLLLIEATPEIQAQVTLLQRLAGQGRRGRNPVDAILLTHAHIGHYLGLAQLGREVTSTTKMPVFASARMAEFLRSNGPWNQLVELEQIEIEEVVPGEIFQPWDGLRIMAVPVPHREEYSDTMAFKVFGPRGTLLFVPDVDSWKEPGLLEHLLEGVTVAYVDATFYDGREVPGRNLDEISHPPMIDTMARLEAWADAHPFVLHFIHLNHTNPALRDPSIREEVERRGFRIAERGETVGI